KTKLILWKETQGPQMWGWQTGIASDYTHAIEEAADGKVWILRQTQLLVYDPKGDPVANSAKFDGWEEMPILGIACRGFEGSVWYMEKNSGKVVRFDGTARKTWLIPGEPERRYAVIEVVSDRNEAVVRDSRGRYFLLQQNGAVIKTRGRKEGVLQMAVAGAKEFKASGPAPVVTAGGRLYFDGEIRSGKQWIKTQKGSGILDLRGELLVMANENSPRPYVYRFNGNKAEEIGTADRYLLDSHGLRWYDPGIIEDNPKRFPVLFIEKRGEKVALSPDSPKHGPLYGARKAIRVGVESFVVMQKYGGMFFLSPEGLKKIDVTRIPFGSEEALLHPLGNQRYAWLLRSRIFISPTEFQLVND
ncbi:MAG: hypothetical protein QF886_04820, partial [Planctomycetota bacterium]|nr:hypothetical protein [Planctomycetota bacterium]